MMQTNDPIVAIATPNGSGAIGVIRLSGVGAIEIADAIFSKDLLKAKGYTLHFGEIREGERIVDEVLLSLFRGPKSYTREDTVEISCHGSSYILQEVLQLCLKQGARLAEPGEFTRRAWLNGAMDLAQAEAVADLIASTSQGAHQLAMSQLRGGISDELKVLRTQLLDFTSLIELELDFSEEDVEFADRSQLEELVESIRVKLESLINSFRLGNAIKQGVPTVILGKPNAGKSTLLNSLLNDNRAIVSDIPGTTRDVIEDRLHIEGIEFRLMDTAGVRETSDVIEQEGVNRSLALAQSASLLIYVFDATEENPLEAQAYIQSLDLPEHTEVILLANKSDLLPDLKAYHNDYDYRVDQSLDQAWTMLSAKTKDNLQTVRDLMVLMVQRFSESSRNQPLISNVRHLTALQRAQTSLLEVAQGLESGLTGDLLTIDIRTVLHYIGEITGEISTDEVLGNIFGKFCIGK